MILLYISSRFDISPVIGLYQSVNKIVRSKLHEIILNEFYFPSIFAYHFLLYRSISYVLYQNENGTIRITPFSVPLHPALRVNRIFFSEPCEKTYCSWGATCVVSENGKPLCQCPTDCPSTSEPVCGSDNVTYTNYCHLRKSSCLERKSTRVKNQGACGEYIPFRLFVPIAFQLSKWTDRILVKVRLEGGGGGGSRYRVVSPW